MSKPVLNSLENKIEHFVKSYGDVIFDLCESVLRSPANAQVAFRAILKKLRFHSRFEKFQIYERSWVFQITCQKLLEFCKHYQFRVSPEEQIKLDATDKLSNRFEQFEVCFHRLTPEDQILLILKDKYEVPISEISTALATPIGSLKIRRQQALRALEDWIWHRK